MGTITKCDTWRDETITSIKSLSRMLPIIAQGHTHKSSDEKRLEKMGGKLVQQQQQQNRSINRTERQCKIPFFFSLLERELSLDLIQFPLVGTIGTDIIIMCDGQFPLEVKLTVNNISIEVMPVGMIMHRGNKYPRV
jgi:hypothetical protein